MPLVVLVHPLWLAMKLGDPKDKGFYKSGEGKKNDFAGLYLWTN